MCLCSSSIPACTCSWPWEEAKTDFLQGGITHLSISVSTVFTSNVGALSVFNCLNHVVHLFFLEIYADNLILSKVVKFAYITWYYNHILSIPPYPPCVSLCVCAWYSGPSPHLPGLTAPPAGIGGDVQTPTAGLPGQEGELPDCAANETPQVDGWHTTDVVGL